MWKIRVSAVLVYTFIVLTDSLAQTDSWQALSEAKPDAVILIYLKNGGRMKQRLTSYDQHRLVTDAGIVLRRDIAAVSLYRPERLWDGTLRGGAIGAAGVAFPALAERNTDGIAGGIVFGFLAGAGLGALFDAAVAKPDKPLFVDSANDRPSLRNWSLRVPHEGLANWLKGQRVELMLKDGTYVRGKVERGTDSTLEIEVHESSMPHLKETGRVNTAEVGTVIFRQKLGGSKAAAATGGAISGFWLGMLAAVLNDTDSGPRLVAAPVGGALAGGLLSGFGINRMNQREITLVVE